MVPRKNNLTFGQKAVSLLRKHREELRQKKKRKITFGQALEDIMIKAGILTLPSVPTEKGNETESLSDSESGVPMMVSTYLKDVLSKLKAKLSNDLGRPVQFNEVLEFILDKAGIKFVG